ncbi:ROK family protein [Pantoea sp. LMR881]|uniref:ROK family protein n=1 Tax=Pantoea sp. LMR881 TaxID=3014336 RepID=UPI0022AE7C56|nr:ROK family protein [Pantoea sp. LMR881]MCZ4061443.1 ROK family protein [Pantoea sp. LMR881]
MKIAAFDIGGTSLKMGVITDKGDIRHQDKADISHNSRDKILNEILDWLKNNPGCEGIAVSVPGYVDSKSGFISMGGTVREFDGFHLSQWLTEKTSLPVSVENDAHCALLAERWLGKAKNMSDFLMLTIGTGLGGAAFCNNALIRGKRDRAGEFGCILTSRPASSHVTHYTMSKTCTMTALREYYCLQKDIPSEEISGKEVFDQFDQGDPIASRLVTTFYQDLSAGLYNLAAVFDPDTIFIGGGIAERESFLEEVRFHLEWFSTDIKVDTATYGNESGMLGAVYHFLKTQEQ